MSLVVSKHFHLVALALGHVLLEPIFNQQFHVFIVALNSFKNQGYHVESPFYSDYALLKDFTITDIVLDIWLITSVEIWILLFLLLLKLSLSDIILQMVLCFKPLAL